MQYTYLVCTCWHIYYICILHLVNRKFKFIPISVLPLLHSHPQFYHCFISVLSSTIASFPSQFYHCFILILSSTIASFPSQFYHCFIPILSSTIASFPSSVLPLLHSHSHSHPQAAYYCIKNMYLLRRLKRKAFSDKNKQYCSKEHYPSQDQSIFCALVE